MRVIFMGTPQLAVNVLRQLIESAHEVVAVVTQPDKPAGRRQQTAPTPVKTVAINNSIPVLQPTDLKEDDFLNTIENLNADIGIVFAYGRIIPSRLLNLPKYGMINIHASLLPRWRGAAPIQRAILAGDEVAGVTIMQMDTGLDTGDVLLSRKIPIEDSETAGSLTEKMSEFGAKLLIEALDKIDKREITPIKQNSSNVTYAEKITDKDLEIDWARTASAIDRQVRGLSPKPGAFTLFNGKKLKIWRASKTVSQDIDALVTERCASGDCSPGSIVAIDKQHGPVVSTGDGPLVLEEVQPENKKKLGGAEFIRGYRMKIGEKFGQ